MDPAEESAATVDTWRDYRLAFGNFAGSVHRFQVLNTHPIADRSAIDAAVLEMEKASVIYNDRRDAAALELMPSAREPFLRTKPGML